LTLLGLDYNVHVIENCWIFVQITDISPVILHLFSLRTMLNFRYATHIYILDLTDRLFVQ